MPVVQICSAAARSMCHEGLMALHRRQVVDDRVPSIAGDGMMQALLESQNLSVLRR